MESRRFTCPRCGNETSHHAARCSNPDCRAELGFCSFCRDVTTTSLVAARSAIQRRLYRCDKCGEQVVHCSRNLVGGNCNGLARAGKVRDHLLCDDCADALGANLKQIGGGIAGVALSLILGGLFRRKQGG